MAFSREAAVLPAAKCAGAVVFVGGGPVGLWTAAQLKLLAPALRVLVLEKYDRYQRRHVLRINPRSLRTPLAANPMVRTFLENLPPVIRTSDLEQRLEQLAHDAGVDFQRQREVRDSDLKTPVSLTGTPEAPLLAVVGSDGAHSQVRRALFADAISSYEEVMYACELKYEAEGETRGLHPVREAYPVLKLMKHAAQEYVGSPGPHRTPITIRLLVSASEFVEMNGATFREPLKLHIDEDRSRVPSEVLESLEIWLNARAAMAGERRADGTAVISVTSLAPYRSAVFVRREAVGPAPALLVGDAAFGVPFFRSLNNGLVCGTLLATCLQELASAQGRLDQKRVLDAYALAVDRLAEREIRTARTKRSLLKMVRWWCGLSSHVPWQTIRLSRSRVRELHKPVVFPSP